MRELCTSKVDEYIKNGKYGPISYQLRTKNCLCKEDQAKMKMHISYIQEYIESETPEFELEVDSYILRKVIRSESRDILGKEY